ncbi:MAG: anthranilate phosphoribosyltransferase [Thermoanaerobaculia bacterium]|nr:anthranilate phosphoribosyltransferase [Thermoanaerobaculia bacterium]
MSCRVLMLDNFDSFTYNLVDFFRQLGCPVKVYRNTADPESIAREDFDLLVLSPGPSVPRNAGNLMKVIARFHREKPILGVCLGHQALVEFFGGTLENIAPVHGKSVPVGHDGRGIFAGLEPEIRVARYHSWAAKDIPSELEVSARAADGTVMAVRHKHLPVEGIQFHPESVLSMYNNVGMRLLQNVAAGRLSAGNRIYHELSRTLQTGVSPDAPLLRVFLQAVEEGQLTEDQKQILLVSLSLRLREAGALKELVDALLFGSPRRHGDKKNIEYRTANVEYRSPVAYTGYQDALRHFDIRHSHPVDICGTGGSGLPRINTSTLTALLLAHCGLPVAKHGNRAAAGRFGSFNLLEALDVPIRFDAEKARRTLAETNLAFLFAPDIYPVFRHFAPVRAQIGVPTVFNVLGPLLNPCQPDRQFIGTAFADLMDVIFETGIRMGKSHLIVARGHDGLDEISVSAPSRVLEYFNGQRREYEIEPAGFGIRPLPPEAVSAANPAECLAIARAMIAGAPTTEHYKLVAANAAFIYTRFLEDIPLPEAFRKMERLVFSGAMGEVLERFMAVATEDAVCAA